MRTIKELLELMLEHQELFSAGLCCWCNQLNNYKYISDKEFCILYDYIQDNRPSKYSSLDAYKYRQTGYYWKDGEIKPRIKWLKKHIKKNS